MTLTSTLKIYLGLTVTIGLISIGCYILNETTEFQPTENTISVVNTVESERPTGKIIQIEAPKTVEPIKMIWEEPMPEPEFLEVVEIVAENSTVTVFADQIRKISDCSWYCNGGCRVSRCYIEKIEELPIVEEDESLLDEQVFADPYEFEAKTYPNPTIGTATVELDIEMNDNFTIQLFDLSGKLITEVFNGHLDEGRQSFQIDLNDYQTGMYFVSIQSLFQQETLKIQKI